MKLSLDDGTTVAFDIRSTATTGKTFGAWLAADFAVQAAKTNFSGTSTAISSSVNSAMEAAAGTAKNNFVLVNGISVSNAAHLIL